MSFLQGFGLLVALAIGWTLCVFWREYRDRAHPPDPRTELRGPKKRP